MSRHRSTEPKTVATNFNSIEELSKQYPDQPLVKLHWAIEHSKDELKSLADECKADAEKIGFDQFFLLKILLISKFLKVSSNEMCFQMQFDQRVLLMLGLRLGDKIPASTDLDFAQTCFNRNNTLQKAFDLVTKKR